MTEREREGRRIAWIDQARGLSIVLVVLLHATMELEFLDIRSPWLNGATALASSLRMPVFFAAAGLLSTGWLTRRSRSEFCTGKLLPLLWVYLAWQPVVLAYKLAETLWLPNQPVNTVLTQLAKVVLAPVRPNGETWFLWALLLYFLLGRLTAESSLAVRAGAPVLVSATWSSATPWLPPELLRAVGDGWIQGPKYVAFFAVSAAFAPAIIRGVSTAPRWALVGAPAAWAGFLALVESGALPDRVPGVFFVRCVLGVLAGFALARIISRVGGVRRLGRLGRTTLPIYVGHIAVLVAATLVLHLLRAAPILQRDPCASVVVLTVVGIAGSLLLHRVLMRTRVGRWMYGPPAWALAGPRGRSSRTVGG